MNIAYLIIAWNKPHQLKRLVDRLTQANVHCYIHIDKKNTDFKAFSDIFQQYSNVTLVSEYKVYWGGFSQVNTAQYLLRLAAASAMEFKYYVFLSGQDYPIKTNDYINDFFERNSCDFLSYNRIEDMAESFTNKYRYYHFLDFKYVNPKDPRRNKLLYYLFYGFYRRFGKFIPHRSFYKDFTPYFGSDWLVLHRDSVKFILDFVEKNKDYSTFMKYVEIPSELFIHNILLNSERRTNLCDYDKFTEWLKTRKPGELFNQSFSSLRYMDWSERGKEFTKPAILDVSYFETIKNDPNLFARKMDDKLSDELLDRIDAEILKIK